MRKKIFVMVTLLSMGLCACGNSKTKETDTKITEEVTTEATPEPTATLEPTTTLEPTVTQEPTAIPEPTEIVQDGGDPLGDIVNMIGDAKEQLQHNKPVATETITEMSDDIYSLQISINNVIYQFPMTFESFAATGWTYTGGTDEMLRSGAYMVSDYFQAGKDEINAYVINFGINETAVNECYVGGVFLDTFGVKECKVILPKNIELGVSTIEDTKAAYGEPSDIYEGDTLTTMTYETDSYCEVELIFDCEKGGKLYKIELKNFVEPDNFDAGEVSDEVPEITSIYQAPKKVDSDLMTYTVDYAGGLYQLPAPVSEFIKNGWVIDEKNTDTVIAGNDYGKVVFQKDHKEFYAYVNNYDTNATSYQNCFVTSLTSDEYGCNVPMTVANNISIGMSEAELEKALKNYDYEKEQGTSYVSYEVSDERGLSYGYEIIVREGKVTKIDMDLLLSVSEYRKLLGLE